MAVLFSKQTGNLTTNTTWGAAFPVASQPTGTVSQNLTTTQVNSPAFTADANVSVQSIAVFFANRPGTTGTIRVAIYNVDTSSEVSGSVLTCNVNLLTRPSGIGTTYLGWVVFRYSSPVALTNGVQYALRMSSSSNNQVSVRRSSTTNDFVKHFILTGDNTPAAADQLHVVGALTGTAGTASYTVTVDNTADVTFGECSVSKFGTLQFATSAGNYLLKLAGNLTIYIASTFAMGTSGTPIPVGTTATLHFVCATDGQYSLQNLGGASTFYGAVPANWVPWTMLNGSVSSGSNVNMTSDDATQWSSGDEIVVATTTLQASNANDRTTLASNASGTSLVASSLSFSHLGETPPFRAEIINLTRNVKIRGQSASLRASILVQRNAQADFRYAEFSFLGTSSILGIQSHADPFVSFGGLFRLRDCSLHDFGMGVDFPLTGNGPFTLTNNVSYDFLGTHFTLPDNAPASTFSDNVMIKGDNLLVSPRPHTITGNHVVQSSTDAGMVITSSSLGTTSNNVSHAHLVAVRIESALSGECSTLTCYDSNYGLSLVGTPAFESAPLIFTDCTIYGLLNAVSLSNANNVTFRSSTPGISTSTIGGAPGAFFINSVIQVVDLSQGISLADITVNLPAFGSFVDTTMAPFYGYTLRSTFTASQVGMAITGAGPDSRLVAFSHSTAGDDRVFMATGTVTLDETIFDATFPSIRMTPQVSSSFPPLRLGPFPLAVREGEAPAVGFRLRKSNTSAGDAATYNGTAPLLIALASPLLGIASNVTVAQATVASNGAWETASGTAPTPAQDGIMQFIIEVPFGTGWVNIDSVGLPAQPDGTSLRYWNRLGPSSFPSSIRIAPGMAGGMRG